MTSANQMLKQAADRCEAAPTGSSPIVNAQVKPLTDSVMGTSTEASLMLQEARKRLELRDGEPHAEPECRCCSMRRKLVDNLNRDLPRLIGPMVQALTKTTATLDQAQVAVGGGPALHLAGLADLLRAQQHADRIQSRGAGDPRLRRIHPAQSQRLADRQQVTASEIRHARSVPPHVSPSCCCCARLAGCGNDKPTRLYVLTATTEKPAATSPNGVAIGVGPITLPKYLDRPQIVTRRQRPMSLAQANFDQWGGDLNDNITRVLADQSVQPARQPTASRSIPGRTARPSTIRSPSTSRQFEQDKDGSSVLSVFWSIVIPKDGTVVTDAPLELQPAGAQAGATGPGPTTPAPMMPRWPP